MEEPTKDAATQDAPTKEQPPAKGNDHPPRPSHHSNGSDGSRRSKSERWIHSAQGTAFFAGCISANAILLGVEVDANQGGPAWAIVDVLFTAIFTAECSLRLEAERWSWHKDLWNVLDAALVLIGYLDLTFLLVTGETGDARILSVARLLRLLRISRLVKVVRIFRELSLLINSFAAAVRATAWAMMLFLMVNLICSLFVTRLIGKDCCEEGDVFGDPRFGEWFGSVGKSMFTLFTIATLEGWVDFARAAFEQSILIVIFVIAFAVASHTMLLQVVTAIVIEHVIEQAETEEAKIARRLEEEQTRRLKDIFTNLDRDGNQRLSLQEIEAALDRSYVTVRSWPVVGDDMLKSVQLAGDDDEVAEMLQKALQHANMSRHDAKELFHVLDTDDSNWLTKEEFVEGMAVAIVQPRAINVKQISREVRRLRSQLLSITSSLRGLDSALASARSREAEREPPELSELRREARAESGTRRPEGGQRTCTQDSTSSGSAGDLSVPGEFDGEFEQVENPQIEAAELAKLRAEMLQAIAAAEERLRKQVRGAVAKLEMGQRLLCEEQETSHPSLLSVAPSNDSSDDVVNI